MNYQNQMYSLFNLRFPLIWRCCWWCWLFSFLSISSMHFSHGKFMCCTQNHFGWKMCCWWWNYTKHNFILLWLLTGSRICCECLCVYSISARILLLCANDIHFFRLACSRCIRIVFIPWLWYIWAAKLMWKWVCWLLVVHLLLFHGVILLVSIFVQFLSRLDIKTRELIFFLTFTWRYGFYFCIVLF